MVSEPFDPRSGDSSTPPRYKVDGEAEYGGDGESLTGVQGAVRSTQDGVGGGVREALRELQERDIGCRHAIKVFVDDTSSEIKGVYTIIDEVKATVSREMDSVKTALGHELESVKTALSSEIAHLTVTVDRVLRADPGARDGDPSASAAKDPGGSAAGQFGHHSATPHRGTIGVYTSSSPVGGNCSDRQKNFPQVQSHNSDHVAHGPRVDLPQFDGANPKLWQRRCVEYFQRWQTPATMWVSYSSSLFVSDAAVWLESYLQQVSCPTWSEFVTTVLARFSRNQHQILVRRLFHINQTTTIEDYVYHFAQLMDQITAYEAKPDPVHYTTRFLDGLKPAVRVLVAIQQPSSLDAAYNLALLYEELGDGSTPLNSSPQGTSSSSSRRAQSVQLPTPQPPPPPPARWVSHTVEEKRTAEQQQKQNSDDKWTNIKAFRRSKGLCFTCGEKWGREHQCKTAIQLHVVQEMINFMPSSEDNEDASEDVEHTAPAQQHQQQLMLLSSAALSTDKLAPKTMQLQVHVQGQVFLFLVDSGSSACFIDQTRAMSLAGRKHLATAIPVQVAGGAILQSTEFFPQLQWTAEGVTFSDTFRVLQLESYDGIIGLDWLGKYSPMVTHWEQGWIAIQHEGQQVVLHGEGPVDCTHALIELHLIHEFEPTEEERIPDAVQNLLDQFASVFQAPVGLPPHRRYDHHTPTSGSQAIFSLTLPSGTGVKDRDRNPNSGAVEAGCYNT